MDKISEGVWMAQGPHTNIIIKVIGNSPFIKIVKGISMNDFFQRGTVKELTEGSVEIQHILQNPELYDFEPLTVTEAVNNILGVGSLSFEKVEIDQDELEDLVKAYQNQIQIYADPKEADNSFIIKLCKDLNIRVGQARNILENKIKRAINCGF